MKSFMLPIAVLASAALAQTTTTCGADYIVEACLSSEKAKLEACGNSDYECKCNQWKNILTCYNNCPNDPRIHESSGQRDIFCSYVTQFATTSTSSPVATEATTAPAQSTSQTDEDEATPTTSGNGSPTSTNDSTQNNGAADVALNAGSILAAVAGVVAVVL